MTNQQRPFWGRRYLRSLIAAVVVLGLGTLVVWGFIEGRGEANREAERERPIKAPLRVSMKNGAPVITLDAETQEGSGIATTTPESAPYQEQIRAYATVLDLSRLTELSNSYANAKAQLQTAQAKL